jgi:glycosyltransferase involved in cell wall biosynthesis
MKISLVLYVYPGIEKYLDDLIRSINNQSYKEFDIIIFNDQLEHANHLFETLSIRPTILGVQGSPNEIRFNSLRDIKAIGSEYIIFQDADDFMAENRIEENLKSLRNYDLVVNDLSLINENSRIMENSYWTKRLGNDFEFGENFLRDKNIVGLGNTSIKKSLLIDPRLSFSPLPLAFDWFLFYQIFKLNNLKALFITSTTTYYRQHLENIAGIKKLDFPRLKHVLNVKNSHYNALSNLGFDFKKELYQLNQIQIEVVDFLKFNSEFKNFNLLWWEETNNLTNKI